MTRARALLTASILSVATLGATPGCLVNRFENLGVSDRPARAELARATIVFTKDNELYLARGDGGGAVRLLSRAEIGVAGAVFMPMIDGAGRRVLFLSVIDLEIRESTGRDLSLNILTLDRPAAPGGRVASWRKVRLEKIAPPGVDGRQEIFAVAGAAWSHDGDRIALGLNRAREAGGDAVALFDSEGSATTVCGLAGRDLARVSAISWTNDDRALILGLEGEGEPAGRVARLDLPTTGQRAAAPVDLAPGRYPALSPDGSRIAVVAERSGQSDIVLLDLDGNETARYERPAGRAPSRPFWSAGGRYLYYYSLGATGPLGLIDIIILRCMDTRTQRVFDLIRLG